MYSTYNLVVTKHNERKQSGIFHIFMIFLENWHYEMSRTVIVNKTTTHPYPHYKPISAGVGVIGDCILHEWNLYMLIVVNIYVAFQFIVVNCQMWLLNVSQCKKLSLCRYVMQSFFSSQKDESNRRCRSWKFHHLHVKIISSFRNRRVKLRAFYS